MKLSIEQEQQLLEQEKHLIKQEKQLHQFDIRKDITKVTQLLHPSFIEVGRSGTRYDFKSIVESLKNEESEDGVLHSQDYECIKMQESVYLLLYQSAYISKDAMASDFAKRSSIWVLDKGLWQMKYHQGTACDAFDLTY